MQCLVSATTLFRTAGNEKQEPMDHLAVVNVRPVRLPGIQRDRSLCGMLRYAQRQQEKMTESTATSTLISKKTIESEAEAVALLCFRARLLQSGHRKSR